MSNSQRLQRVLALCTDVLDQPGAERMAYLAEACEGDFRLRASVESVLVALKDARRFMDVADIRADNFADFVGENAGDYQLLELLGVSPLGGVYRATGSDGEVYAVRVVRGHLWARELIERFSDELDLFTQVRDPYIASLVDGGVTVNGSPYLVYEFVDGMPLDEYCDRGRLSVSERVRLVRSVARAVHVGHQHLTAWRSVRPSNVLVTEDGTPKVLDFALGTLLHRQHGPIRSLDTSLLSMWMSQFAAPETFEGLSLTVSADVYSLGAMTYDLLTGQRRPSYPMDEATRDTALLKASEQVSSNDDWALREAIAHRRATTTDALAKSLVGSIDGILHKAMRADPLERFESASSFAQALTRFLAGKPLSLDDDASDEGSEASVSAFALGMAAGVATLALVAYLHFVKGYF
ncbi:MAG: serine/threonine protein kinase [Gammaproteobacteria bacterium]